MTTICFSRRDERGGQQAVGGEADVEHEPAVDLDARAGEVLERLAPDVEHGVGAEQGVAQRAGLFRVERLGLLAVARGGEVEVARHAQQLVGRDGAARPAAAVGDVGLDRAEVAPAVEDDRELLAERQPADPQGDRRRGVLVDQGPAEQFVGEMVVHVPSISAVR